MSLWKIREERKKLGPRPKKGPGNLILILLLILTLALMFFLNRVG